MVLAIGHEGRPSTNAQGGSLSAASSPGRRPRVFLAGTFLSVHGGSRSPIEDLAERLTEVGFGCVCASSIRRGSLRSLHLLLSLVLRRRSYDLAIVDLFSGNAFLWGESAGLLLRAMRVPFVYSMHGGALPEFASSRAGRVASCLARATAVTAPSGYLLEKMRPYCAGSVLMPNPLKIADYPFRLRGPAEPSIIWVRRFHEIYRPAMAPAVMAALAAEWPDVHLTMVGGDTGDGSLERTRETAARLGVASRITFTGAVPRSHVRKLLSKADVFLNTTDVDNTPLSVLEAMACGLCIVSTDAGGVPYLVKHEYDGLLVPCGDVRAAAAAISRITNNPGLAAKLSRNARTKTEAFDWSRVLPEWQQLLTTLTAPGPGEYGNRSGVAARSIHPRAMSARPPQQR